MAPGRPPLPFSPASERNRQPILEVLQQVLPRQGAALEIAAGTGQHACWFAAALSGWTWQPTDGDAGMLPAISAWKAHEDIAGVLPPMVLDVMSPAWPVAAGAFDAVYCANMLHIAPWAACAALMQGAARHLTPDGLLLTYGPYLEDTVPTSAGNRAFDTDLRARNAAWGIRRREAVQAEAAAAGFHLRARHALPAHNLLLVFGRGTPA